VSSKPLSLDRPCLFGSQWILGDRTSNPAFCAGTAARPSILFALNSLFDSIRDATDFRLLATGASAIAPFLSDRSRELAPENWIVSILCANLRTDDIPARFISSSLPISRDKLKSSNFSKRESCIGEKSALCSAVGFVASKGHPSRAQRPGSS